MKKKKVTMNQFETGLERYLGRDQLKSIQKVHIGIAGTGGLGSNCAACLVRCGFKTFTLVDDDIVEPSNLNRQFFFLEQTGEPKVEMLKANLLAINPDLAIQAVNRKLDARNITTCFESCDAVIEAFDTAKDKTMMVETFIHSNKLLVAASGIGGWGESDAIKTRKIRKNFFLVGDGVSEADDTCPPLSPRVAIAAAKQADIVLTYFLKEENHGQQTGA